MSMEKVLRHKAICDELNKLYEKKNHDYGDSFHQTFVEEGLAMTRIPGWATSFPGSRLSPASPVRTVTSSRLRTSLFGTR